jgi:DNA-binding PadR family transcriptional regulator
MPTDHKNPLSFLPLTPFAFQVLLALADGERHGYAIIKEVEERSGGTVTLRTGTLYTLLQRLLDEQLIGETAVTATPATPNSGVPLGDRTDSRRRYYRLTALGDAVLRAEAQRLENLIGDARRKHVLNDAGGV